jgi:hypothetical protein
MAPSEARDGSPRRNFRVCHPRIALGLWRKSGLGSRLVGLQLRELPGRRFDVLAAKPAAFVLAGVFGWSEGYPDKR